MTPSRNRAAAVSGLLVATLACGAGDPSPTGPPRPAPPNPTAITFGSAVQPILTNNCAFVQCHAGPSPQEGMDLSDGQAFANIVSVTSSQVPRLFRVEPNRPDSSYISLKLEGNAGSVGGVGTQMPLGGQLTQAQIDTIRSWISTGAENN